jgi:CHAT domain-containing protein
MQRPEPAQGLGASAGLIDSPNAPIATADKAIEVPVRRLDDLARDRRVGFIKIDVEGFEAAAAAVQQLNPRFASGNDALAALVRQDQDLSAYRRDRAKALVETLARPAGQSNPAQIDAIRRQIEDTERKLATVKAQLEKEFPDYAALSNPRPLKDEDVQKLLATYEALVLFVTGDEQSYVFAVTADGFDWRPIPAGRDAIAAKVTAFRRDLELDTMQQFDLKVANELYTLLLAPVDALVKDKRHLLVAPSGVPTALPFHLLVTEKPATSVPQGRTLTANEDAARFRDAAWLIKRQAVSALPSVSSLQALRSPAQAKAGGKPMIGFGDPVFDPRATPGGQPKRSRSRGQARAYSDYWRGAGIDRNMLMQGLPQLPDTADELRAIAKALDRGRQARGRSAVRAGAGVLLRRRPRAAGVALGGGLGRGHPVDDVGLRHPRGRSDARARRSHAARHAQPARRQVVDRERLSRDLGSVRRGRRRKPAMTEFVIAGLFQEIRA